MPWKSGNMENIFPRLHSEFHRFSEIDTSDWTKENKDIFEGFQSIVNHLVSYLDCRTSSKDQRNITENQLILVSEFFITTFARGYKDPKVSESAIEKSDMSLNVTEARAALMSELTETIVKEVDTQISQKFIALENKMENKFDNKLEKFALDLSTMWKSDLNMICEKLTPQARESSDYQRSKSCKNNTPPPAHPIELSSSDYEETSSEQGEKPMYSDTLRQSPCYGTLSFNPPEIPPHNKKRATHKVRPIYGSSKMRGNNNHGNSADEEKAPMKKKKFFITGSNTTESADFKAKYPPSCRFAISNFDSKNPQQGLLVHLAKMNISVRECRFFPTKSGIKSRSLFLRLDKTFHEKALEPSTWPQGIRVSEWLNESPDFLVREEQEATARTSASCTGIRKV